MTAARMVFWLLWFRADEDLSIISSAGFVSSTQTQFNSTKSSVGLKA